jgi:hypothetical protein
MKKQFSMLIVLLMLSLGFMAPEERTISGKVTSKEDGSPLPGVNVVLKGTTGGTVTDGQGAYLIHVPMRGGFFLHWATNPGSENRHNKSN